MFTDITTRVSLTRTLSNVYNIFRYHATAAADTTFATKAQSDQFRISPIGIQLLSLDLHKQVFGESTSSPDPKSVERSIDHLQDQGLWGHKTSVVPDVSFQLPKLLGSNLDEHFTKLGERYACDYRVSAEKLADSQLPPLPRQWVFARGWTKYGKDSEPIKVESPQDVGLVFDVEVCVREGNLPTLAAAASDDSWYSWCSSQLTREQFKWREKIRLSDLIPLEKDIQSRSVPRIVVGHNVGFDRSFVKEQYFVQGSRLRFLDTLSLHVCVSGLTGHQRALSLASKSAKATKSQGPPPEMWLDISSLNNLADVYALYSGGKKLKKEPRETFMTGTLADIASNFQELMTYCASDVIATHEVLGKLLPLYLERFPHPVSFAGMLEMLTAYLPVNQNWERYLRDADAVYEDFQQELKQTLSSIANSTCALLNDEAYKKDPWLWDLDWSVQNMRVKKNSAKENIKKQDPNKKQENVVGNNEQANCPDSEESDKEQQLRNEVRDILDTAKSLYKVQPFLPGYPAWYREFCTKPNGDAEGWEPGPSSISTQMRSVPKLLRLMWDGYPLHYNETHGWGYLVPAQQKDGTVIVNTEKALENVGPRFPTEEFLKVCGYRAVETTSAEGAADWEKLKDIPEEGIWKLWKKVLGDNDAGSTVPASDPDDDVNLPGCRFVKLPHKDGPHKRVGNPLSKDFLAKVTEGILRSNIPEADHVLLLSKMTSYWKNARDRIMSQMVVWFQRSELPRSVTITEGEQYGTILPRLIPAGTVTRRGVEPTWLTASNAYEDRVGSELKSMVQAPCGYHFVGADVDSQELWIAAILADAYFAGLHGCTAFGWMTLQGSKAHGTDMHSRTASSVGVSRDHAKVMNYARIYGAGLPFAQRLLMQFNHRLTSSEAFQKAKIMYSQTKGVRTSVPEVIDGQEVFVKGGRRLWKGGSESHMFNKLEDIALSDEPRTPVLNCRISRALEPAAVDTNFLNSRINWVVQSSAVDYLHLMLVSMRWLMDDYSIRGRFSISIHDEVRFLVASEDRYRAALALQVTNLLTRSYFAWQLGMRDLPQSVAFFSSVEVDSVVRKEVSMDCVTPSNLHGLERGYGIPRGEALDIYQVLEKTQGGCLSKSAKRRRKKLEVEATS
ncbi:DNA polymerase subunit gamma-1-like [Ornithodoros turicata]|uniref:DNA polymerase subunit gamma-1-like n=1 Tax=Ornithodoros turicata TaxID=34597 RepID=UPI00313A2EB7